MKNKSIWITWERQRRSVELAKAFRVMYYELLRTSDDIPLALIRYFLLSLKTILIIFRERPEIIFAQNPSIILASLLCTLKKVGKYKLVIDRHSNFKLDSFEDKRLKWLFFHYLSKYSVRIADLTIVTNEYLCRLVNSWHGRGFILQDKLPGLKEGECIELAGDINAVFISTFSPDEPIEEVISAAQKLDNTCVVYFTGNHKRYKRVIDIDRLSDNIVFTGFLPEKEYQSLLSSADLLIVFTMQEHTLNCGAYEGIALGKPLVVSDTKAIRNYFNKGVIYSKPFAKSIEQAIRVGIKNREVLKGQVACLREELTVDWDQRFKNLIKLINQL